MNKLLWTLVMVPFSIANLVRAQMDNSKPPAETHIAAVSSAAIDGTKGLIKLDVLVTDELGKPVSGLKRIDFTLLEED